MHSLAPLLSPPVSEAQLLQQAQRLAVYSLGELAGLDRRVAGTLAGRKRGQ